MKTKGIEVKSEALDKEFNYGSYEYEFSTEGTMCIGKKLRLEYEIVDQDTGLTMLKKVERKRTPSEVKMMFIQKYFPDMKNVKDEVYHGHTSKAKKALEELRAAQKAATKKAANKEQ